MKFSLERCTPDQVACDIILICFDWGTSRFSSIELQEAKKKSVTIPHGNLHAGQASTYIGALRLCMVRIFTTKMDSSGSLIVSSW